MRKTTMGFMVATAICLMGTATVASACPITGKVVCTGTTIPADGVDVIFTGYAGGGTGMTFSDITDQNGIFVTHLYGGEYTVNLDPAATISCNGTNETGIDLTASPFEADGPNCPPVNQCVPTMPTGVTFPFCPARPLGNPKAECALFGLVVADKTEISGGPSSVTAAVTAPLALVKAGGCYDVFLNVVQGETPITAPFTQGISHVTYCTCP
jgi:hypothetical protein